MSQPIVTAGEDIPLDAREDTNPPDPETQNAKTGQTAKAVMVDVTTHEERIPGMVKESTVWDVYNNEARKVDNELVKDWTASLNFLLVFAAIFAAVLTAFIIESKKMLEPDQTEILVDITIQYFNSMGNLSRTNLTRPEFEPTSAAISINCCLFASLGASLAAALASVVSLQWVADYDAAITRGGSSAEDRAKRRQFRHAGVVTWKMGEIIAALPLLLYSSVILFWAGAIQWMWTLHYIVGYVVAGGTVITVLFYVSTTFHGAIYVSSPFRTPLSRGLYWLPRWSLSLLGRFLLWVPVERVLRCFARPNRSSHDYLSSENTPTRKAVATWVRKHLLIKDTSRHREDKAAKDDPAFQQEALAWLAEQLPISADLHNRLLLFTSGMLALPWDNPLSPRFLETPWLAIIEFLSKHYMHQIRNPSMSVKDCEGLDVLLRLINHPCIRTEVVPGQSYNQDYSDTVYWEQYPGRWLDPTGLQRKDLASLTFLLARDIPIPSLGSKYELETAFKLIKWRNSTDLLAANKIWSEVFGDIQHYSPEFFESCLILFKKVLTMEQRYERLGAKQSLHMIVEQALSRALTIGEAGALAQAFAKSVIAGSQCSTAVEMDGPIAQPLNYSHDLASSPQEIQGMHHIITLLVARAAKSVSERGHWEPKWAQWVVMMLWIGSSKASGYYWKILLYEMREGADWGHLWGKVDMTMGGLPADIPQIEEIMTLLVALATGYGRLGDPLWINSMKEGGKRSQAIRMLASFDKVVVTESWPELHSALVGLICEDMYRAGVHWPNSTTGLESRISCSDDEEDHLRLLAHIKDPCLALMGAFAYGKQPSTEHALSKNYIIQEKDCLQKLHNMVYKSHSVNDPPALWEFRAAVTPLDHSTMSRHFGDPFDEPEQLARLQLLLQYPTPCHSHSTGLQHLLFHLYKYATAKGYQIVGLGHCDHHPFYDISRNFFNPIIGLLALSDTQDLSLIFWLGAEPEIFGMGGKPRCSDSIRTICNAVKVQPRAFFCLLVDIITERATRHCDVADMLALLEAVEQACELSGDETTTPFLRPLALVLQKLLGQLTDSEALQMASRRGTVVYEAHRICGVLQARSTNNLILSTSHLRILTCARSVALAQPAMSFLKMHIEL